MDTQASSAHETSRQDSPDLERIDRDCTRRGFLIGIAAPALLFLTVYLLRSAALLPAASAMPHETLRLLFYVLLFVGISELGAGFVMRQVMFATDKIRTALAIPGGFERMVGTASTVLSALGASPMIYGTVLFILGADMTAVAVFGLITLACYRILRLSPDFLRKAVAKVQPAIMSS